MPTPLQQPPRLDDPKASSQIFSAAKEGTLVFQKTPFMISMFLALAIMTIGGWVQAYRNQQLVEANRKLSTDMEKVHGKLSEVDQVLERVRTLSQELGVKNDGTESTPSALDSASDPSVGNEPTQAADKSSGTASEFDEPLMTSDAKDPNGVSINAAPGRDKGGAAKSPSDKKSGATKSGAQDHPESSTETLLGRLNDLIVDSHVAEHRLESLAGVLERRQQLLATIPSRVPVRGYISSTYGVRRSPFSGRMIMHKGIDLAARKGTAVVASADGDVIFAGWSRAYGNTIVISHGYGIVTKYAHNSKIYPQVGDHVMKGQIISRVGSTGRSTGAHLHYEVWVNGRTVSPRQFFTEQPSYAALVASGTPKEDANIGPVLASLTNLNFADHDNSLAIGGEGEAIEEAALIQKAKSSSSATLKSGRHSNAAYGSTSAFSPTKRTQGQQNRAILATLAAFLLCFGVFWRVIRHLA